MKYNNENHKQWVVRMLQEIESYLRFGKEAEVEYISAINYAIGYLIGIGWADK